jgi:hypothetical protein
VKKLGNYSDNFLQKINKTLKTKSIKKILHLTSIVSAMAALALMTACQTTGTTQAVSQKQALLAQAGFKVKQVTTPKQQQQVSQLAVDRVSAVKYQGKVYYVFPTAKKDQIYVGTQAQFNAYKRKLQAQQTTQASQQNQQMLQGSPVWAGETAGPRHVDVEVFDGFGPLNVMQGD